MPRMEILLQPSRPRWGWLISLSSSDKAFCPLHNDMIFNIKTHTNLSDNLLISDVDDLSVFIRLLPHSYIIPVRNAYSDAAGWGLHSHAQKMVCVSWIRGSDESVSRP